MSAVAAAIKKVATGPHLSKDLSLEESRAAMLEILAGQVDPVQSAVLLIALRMKRETDEENLGLLQAMQQMTLQIDVDRDDLVIIADPFNGFNRHCPVAAFLPAVLAACDLPALSQGVYEMGPKFGVTHAQVLNACNVKTDLTVSQAAVCINEKQCGWAYVDQAQATPSLFALQTLRTLMIKRPSIATLEKLIMPLKAGRTHLMVGFVHKAYPPVLEFLARQAGYDSAFFVRGLEGGVVPTLREFSNNFQLHHGKMMECGVTPADFGIEQDTRGVVAQNGNPTAAETAELGLAALRGQQGPAYDVLLYGAAIMLWHTGKAKTPAAAAMLVRQQLDNGAAMAHLQRGQK